MKINLISHDNGVGLSQDMALLENFLSARGHKIRRSEWKEKSRSADVNIYLELFHRRHLKTADKHVGIFNMEWFLAKWEDHLAEFTQLWAKSGEAHRWFCDRRLPSTLTGFLSRDLFADGARHRGCLHVRGKSSQKGTWIVLSAWRKYGTKLPPLTVVAHNLSDLDLVPGVEFVQGPITDDRIRSLMNRCRFHICPSETEGWGHYIAEALSCGGVVVTTDASPMNEHVSADHGTLLVPRNTRKEHCITRSFVDSDELADAVMRLAQLSETQLGVMSDSARRSYLRRQGHFCKVADNLLREL